MKICLRELEEGDYKYYLNLMFELTNYEYKISESEFVEKLNESKSRKTIVIFIDEKIVGAGSIFKLIKLHNNPVGLIEDVVITEQYRNMGLGKKMVEYLVDIGINEFKCYKIILNCLDKNIEFYKKINFEVVGAEMKFTNHF